ncbi:snare protein syntaxin-like protein 18/UFE1 [Hortaea werneckii]|nr:snare protein syntaxin-like protein 18/UFE1 [Hortaea werneckii]KAI7529777.1 snare protein syntaxin-like protein 18/UFE1 [Hortaea werneckii]KAI7531039.1 snare protein syntaxin-like protein 18/UFE1 [Hortaea werneckii]KAI7654461.1 snare protein syntaxin-like protein 18/UFE1 [Hortaea werneckii]
MTDITPDFNVCLKEKGSQPVLKRELNIDKIDSFLQEAYTINNRISDLTRELRSIRPSYLSTAAPSRRRHDSNHARPLTDKERDAIDAQSKQLLRQLNSKITELKQVEDVRNQAAESIALKKRNQGGLGALGRWAAGGAVTAKSPEEAAEEAERKTIAAHRESVLMYLQSKLEEAGRVQSNMMESAGGIPYAQDSGPRSELTNGATDSSNAAEYPEELDQEQQQLLAEENNEMLKHYNTQLDQLNAAEKSILEISELQSTLTANIQLQQEHIDQLVQDSYLTTENVGKGNKELKRASERRSTAQAVFWGTCAFCSFLVVWDLVF